MIKKTLLFVFILALISTACKTFGGPSAETLEITPDPELVEQVLTQLPNDGEIPQTGPDSPEMQDLQSIFANIQPAEDGSFQVTVTDQQVNLAMQAALEKAINAPDGPAIDMTNPQVRFSTGVVVFEADVTNPIAGHLVIEFTPYIDGQTLQFEVSSAKIGEINVPAGLLAVAETTINDSMVQAMSEMPGSVVLQDVTIGEGTLTVIGILTA